MKKMEQNLRIESGSNSSDNDGLAATLPVIIEIKVKPDVLRKKIRFRKSKINISTDSPNIAWSDGIQSRSVDRRRSFTIKSDSNSNKIDRNRSNIENIAFKTLPNKDSDEKWRIFEKKPSDKFNTNIRDNLNKNLLAITSNLPEHNFSQDTVSVNSSDSECRCDIEQKLNVVEKASDNDVVVRPLTAIEDVNERPASSHSSTSSSGSSVIVREFKGVSSYSNVIEINKFIDDQSMESKPGVLAMSALSKWEKGETTGTFISSKVNGNWTKSNIRPISSKVNQSQQTAQIPKNRTDVKKIQINDNPEILGNTSTTNTKPNVISHPNIIWILDYLNIKNSLRYSNEIERITLLEALRWQILRSLPAKRDKILDDLVKNDIFEIRSEYKSKNLLETLLWPLHEVKESLVVQNFTARLLNAIVSSKIGRDYFDNVSIVESLVWDLGQNIQSVRTFHRNFIEIDTVEQLAASLAKLSLNQFQQCDMIEKGIIQWIINQLEDIEYSGNIYHFKYLLKFLRIVTINPKQYTMSAEQAREILTFLDKLKKVSDVQKKKHLESLIGLLSGKLQLFMFKDLTLDFNENGLYFDYDIDIAEPYNNSILYGESFLQSKYCLTQKKSFIRIQSKPIKMHKSMNSDQSFAEEIMDFKPIPRKGHIFSKKSYFDDKTDKNVRQRNKKTNFKDFDSMPKIPELILTNDAKTENVDRKNSIIIPHIDFDNSVEEMQRKVHEIRTEFSNENKKMQETSISKENLQSHSIAKIVTIALIHEEPKNLSQEQVDNRDGKVNEPVISSETLIKYETESEGHTKVIDDTPEISAEKITEQGKTGSKDHKVSIDNMPEASAATTGVPIEVVSVDCNRPTDITLQHSAAKNSESEDHKNPTDNTLQASARADTIHSFNMEKGVSSPTSSSCETNEKKNNFNEKPLPQIEHIERFDHKTLVLPSISQNTGKAPNIAAVLDEPMKQKQILHNETEIKLPKTFIAPKNIKSTQSKSKRSYSLESYYYYYRKETIIEKDRRVKSD